MAGKMSSNVKMSAVTNKGLLTFLGVTIAYQICYQAFLLSRLPVDDDSDAVCQVGSLSSGTPKCLEQQLFQSWQRASLQGQDHVLDDAEEELERLTQVRLDEFRSPATQPTPQAPLQSETDAKQGSGILVGEAAPIVSFGTAEKIEKIYSETMANLGKRSNVTPWAQQLLDSQAKLEAHHNHLPSVQHDRHEKFVEEHKKFEEDFDKLYEKTMDAIHHPHKSEYAQHAEDMMKEMEQKKREIESKPSVKHARALARQAKLDQLYNQTLASIRNRHVAEDYAHELSDVMHKFEDRADHLPSMQRAKIAESHRKFDELYDATMAKLQNHSTESAWAHHLEEEQHEMEYKLEHLHDHDHAHHAKAAHKDSLLDEIVQLGRNLCDTPERRARPSCSEFMSNFSNVSIHSDALKHALSPEAMARHQHHVDWRAHLNEEFASHAAQYDKALHDLEEKDHKWEEAFQSSTNSYLEQLCSDPERAAYPACATLRRSTPAKPAEPASLSSSRLRGASTDASTTAAPAAAATSSRLRGASAAPVLYLETAPAASTSSSSRLRGASANAPSLTGWAAVVAAGAGKGHGHSIKDAASVTREQLQSFKWAGKMPSIACIAPITAETATAEKLSALVSNFRLQTYGGRRTLQLLFQHSDIAVSELVHRYADGVIVKAVPVRATGQFPSTTALRYGAWATDADIIARWNADEWYHPDRLAMQVEAMVLAARPVSLLKSWTFHGSSVAPFENSAADKIGWEGAMMGEKGWMQEHWMPLLAEERDMLGGVQAGGIVQIDMPELMAYRVEDAENWHDALEHFHISEDQVALEDAPGACAELPANAAAAGVLQHDVDEKLGAELGGIYKTLVNSRSTVSTSLHTLCEELAEEKHPAQRQRLSKQAEHIHEILGQINERFDAVDKLLH